MRSPLFARPVGTDTAGSGVSFVLATDSALGAEGYELTVSEQGVRIAAPSRGGPVLRRADVAATASAAAELEHGGRSWTVPAGVVRDYPRYAWRGAMLDVARHFFSVDDVKRFIDLLASYKFNVLQLHLTDDQGWRIEITSWPRLTSVGGLTEVGGGEGGFYTQAQYREIVAYAAERFITVVPEIDLPGHTNAALVAYPELNCNGKDPVPYTGIEVGFSSLCTRKPVVMQFVRDVIRELAGDDAGIVHPHRRRRGGRDAAEGLRRVHRQVGRSCGPQGKTMIGWEEISQAPIDSGTVVQLWRSADMAVIGASRGARVVMSPSPHVYLDMKYDSTTGAGPELGGLHRSGHRLRLGSRDAGTGAGSGRHTWRHRTALDRDGDDDGRGGVPAVPRLAAVAEVAWTPAADRQWDEFKVRLGRHGARMTARGINFYRSPQIPWTGPTQ